jgi:hypothetical protein
MSYESKGRLKKFSSAFKILNTHSQNPGPAPAADASPIARCSAAGFSLDYRHEAGLLPLRWCGGLVVGVVAAAAWW